jgi:hypothetical protein
MSKYQVGQTFSDKEDNMIYEIVVAAPTLNSYGQQDYLIKESGEFEDGEQYVVHHCVDDDFFDKWCNLITQ